MRDVIVVGGRCAGATVALLLARRGLDVLVLDRARFPSDVVSSHTVQHSGLAELQRMDLLQAVRSTGCPPLETLTLDFGDFSITGTAPPVDGIGAALAPRRYLLDTILLQSAAAAGAEVREGFRVERLLLDGGRVAGIEGGGGDRPVRERARLVVGADGVNSRVAAAAGARRYDEVPSLLSFFYSYWSGIEAAKLAVYLRPRRGIAVVPTNEELVLVGVAWPSNQFGELRRDFEGNFYATLGLVPDLAEQVRGGHREERIVGARRQPNFFRQPYGPGWALVGDAGYNRDAITAQGIGNAFLSARMLADAITAVLADGIVWEEAMGRYHRRRDRTFKPMYGLTCQMADWGGPPSGRLQLLRRIAGDQRQMDRYVGLFAGTVSIADFMSPENLSQLPA